MRAPIWQVDAFAERPFTGNPAAVVVLDGWPGDAWMQAVAAENNLSETAFLVREGDGWRIRWFTPVVEVDLCGHATLASGWVVLDRLEPGAAQVTFASRSGPLTVHRENDRLVLDFPANRPRPTIFPDGIDRVLGRPVREVLATRDHLVAVLDSADAVAGLAPDLAGVAALPKWAVIVTAPGEDCDFVSRFFAPRKGVAEDPVTGSAHCVLTPFWAKRLGRSSLVARQLSPRGGTLFVEDAGDRIRIGGTVVPYLEGTIAV